MKLKDLLYEIYVDNQGNIVEDADFVIVGTDFFDVKIIDIEKIDLSNKIYFKTSYANWDKKRIAKEIFNQILALYKGTSMEKWNKENSFQPHYKILEGGDFDAPALKISLRKAQGEYEEIPNKPRNPYTGASEKGWTVAEPFFLETPIEKYNYQLDMYDFDPKGLFGSDKKVTIGPGDKAKITSTKDDIDFKLENTNITFIPYMSDGLKDFPNDKQKLKSIIQDIGLDPY
tara:strand:- start:84 stop:773 length:690 start_codon:yes stop_codon:yes gene_type:complete